MNHIAPAKKDSNALTSFEHLSIIIPCAGLGTRMKTSGPKSLLVMPDGRTLLQRQLDLLIKKYPNAEIIVVVGFQAEKILHTIKKQYDVKFIYNPNFENTNVAFSISLGLYPVNNNHVLIVYGDLAFNINALPTIDTTSKILIDTCGYIDSEEVGVIIEDDKKVSNLSFGVGPKWGQMAYLTDKELRIFERTVKDEDTRNWFGYEALNRVIENGGKLLPDKHEGLAIVEIDTSKDMEKLNLIFG